MTVHELIDELLKIPNQNQTIKFARVSRHIIDPHKIDKIALVNGTYYIIQYVNDETLGWEEEWND